MYQKRRATVNRDCKLDVEVSLIVHSETQSDESDNESEYSSDLPTRLINKQSHTAPSSSSAVASPDEPIDEGFLSGSSPQLLATDPRCRLHRQCGNSAPVTSFRLKPDRADEARPLFTRDDSSTSCTDFTYASVPSHFDSNDSGSETLPVTSRQLQNLLARDSMPPQLQNAPLESGVSECRDVATQTESGPIAASKRTKADRHQAKRTLNDQQDERSFAGPRVLKGRQSTFHGCQSQQTPAEPRSCLLKLLRLPND